MIKLALATTCDRLTCSVPVALSQELNKAFLTEEPAFADLLTAIDHADRLWSEAEAATD